MAVLFWIGSVRMVLFSNSWFLVFMPKLWFRFLLCEEFEISDYFILTDFASLSKATLEEIHSLIVPGLCRFMTFAFLTCFPGNDDSRTLSEFSGKLPLHCTLESVLSWYLFCFIFLHETVLQILFEELRIRDISFVWVSFQLALAVFLSLWNVVLFSSPSY